MKHCIIGMVGEMLSRRKAAKKLGNWKIEWSELAEKDYYLNIQTGELR